MLTVICLVGAAQGLVLAVAILSRWRGGERGDRLLGITLLVGAGAVAVVALTHQPAVSALHRPLVLLEIAGWLAFGPLIYLYVLRITGGSGHPALWLHLLPAVAWALYVAAALPFHPRGGLWLPPVLGLMGYQMLYSALAVQRLVDRWSSSPPPGIHRFWAGAWLAVLVLQHVAQVVRYLGREIAALDDVVPLTGAAGFLVLTFLGLRRSGLVAAAARPARRRYAGSSLSAGRAGEIDRRLGEALERDRRFLDGGLTLEGLADELDVPRNHLSQVINERRGLGFLELLHSYRIDEAKRLLADPAHAHLTVEAIAGRSGFNSRSAFYDAFRRVTGLTPAGYRDRAQT